MNNMSTRDKVYVTSAFIMLILIIASSIWVVNKYKVRFTGDIRELTQMILKSTKEDTEPNGTTTIIYESTPTNVATETTVESKNDTTTTTKVETVVSNTTTTEKSKTSIIKDTESKFVSVIDEIKTHNKITTTSAYTTMSPQEFRKAGVIYYNGYRFTYYSERVLPGPNLKIPGRHSDGNFVRDENNYICVASSDLPKGTIVDTPFGAGKVYDTGCSSGTIDIYVSW